MPISSVTIQAIKLEGSVIAERTLLGKNQTSGAAHETFWFNCGMKRLCYIISGSTFH